MLTCGFNDFQPFWRIWNPAGSGGRGVIGGEFSLFF